MNKPLMWEIAHMIPTIPGDEWDFDHIWCGTSGCAIGHAIERGIIHRISDGGVSVYFDTFYGSAAAQLGLDHLTFMELFSMYPYKTRPTREFVRNRLVHFIETGEIKNDVPD